MAHHLPYIRGGEAQRGWVKTLTLARGVEKVGETVETVSNRQHGGRRNRQQVIDRGDIFDAPERPLPIRCRPAEKLRSRLDGPGVHITCAGTPPREELLIDLPDVLPAFRNGARAASNVRIPIVGRCRSWQRIVVRDVLADSVDPVGRDRIIRERRASVSAVGILHGSRGIVEDQRRAGGGFGLGKVAGPLRGGGDVKPRGVGRGIVVTLERKEPECTVSAVIKVRNIEWAAQVASPGIVGNRAQGNAGSIVEKLIRIHACPADGAVGDAVKVIRAGLQKGVQDETPVAPHLGIVGIGHDLYFLRCLDGWDDDRSASPISHRHSIDEIVANPTD